MKKLQSKISNYPELKKKIKTKTMMTKFGIKTK
jgi:hypothetical protein